VTSASDTIAAALKVSGERADRICRALVAVAGRRRGKEITVHEMVIETGESSESIKKALVALLFVEILRGRFVPYHMRCDQQIGPDEASEDEIHRKAESGEYPILCPACHDYLEGDDDILVRVLFSLGGEAACE